MKTRFRALVLGLSLAVTAASVAAAQAPHADKGAAAYQRCAACHLPTGAGVPGAFPRIAGRIEQAAATEEGRAYLVMVVSKGLMGEIEVDGKKYRGVMPAQAGMSDEDVAAVLNYAASLKPATPVAAPKAEMKPFTAEEVAAIRAKHMQANPKTIHDSRAAVYASPAPASGDSQ